MEKYLQEDYDVYESKYLTDKSEIVEYFEDCGREFFNCGQGYYEDEVSLICKIGDKFYDVEIQAEIGSAKQDIGDRLYWVDGINTVEYNEINKPLPKDRTIYTYELELTNDQRTILEDFMQENNIKFNK
ncbi:hypothetical protein [Paenibacillus donghaensis]|uniref:Uncharacterized protein n=1 Tax=Paenibacillus donghaensis TaxID=414771 RepID=A0A2Z2KK04_9BACL|nr:hypothetical protein [Paenibacillus donghaensis]ASA22669.1 hypothetical protein B9T62_18855 [Paenibacillus donghaensis]